jgi:hypothetical protein
MKSARVLVILSILLPACGHSVALAPEAKDVELIHESDRPLHCKMLGKINGESRASDEKLAREGAENDFRNHAAELKANFAMIDNERGGKVGTSSEIESFIGGKALACETEAMEEAKEKAEAKAKEQKELDDAKREEQEKEDRAEKDDKKKGDKDDDDKKSKKKSKDD